MKQELESFENYLIDNNVLEDSSAVSYYNCYMNIAKTGELPKTRAIYDLDTMILNHYFSL